MQDVPLLVETGQAGSFDLVLVVEADAGDPGGAAGRAGTGRGRRPRPDRRPGHATSSGGPSADVVLDNSGTPEELAAQVDRFWAEHVLPGLPGSGAPADASA